MPDSVCLALSIDVEEEGLFRGKYQCRGQTHANVAFLEKLRPLLDRGARPTLFCTHGAFTDPVAADAINGLRAYGSLEIGCHLHFWNTPPVPSSSPDILAAVPANCQDVDLMAAKIQRLVVAAKDFSGDPPASFRMGRWDLHKQHWQLLADAGFRCDASVRPLHAFGDPDLGPDHFEAPGDPYRVSLNRGSILEVPLTVVPLHGSIPAVLRKSGSKRLCASLRHWGALALLPVQHPLWLMKLTTLLHFRRGGKVLSLTWHSSEMMPGATPHLGTKDSVAKFLDKVAAYIDWLVTIRNLRFTSMSDLQMAFGNSAPEPAGMNADWLPDPLSYPIA